MVNASNILHPASGARRRRSFTPRRGFTLLELVVVMLILTVMLAMVAPSLSGFGRGRQAEQAAANILALARWAREQAISDGRVYRLNFSPQDQTYWVTAAAGGGYETLAVDFGRPFTLPDGVTATFESPSEGSNAVVEFMPTGRTQAVRIHVLTVDGRQFDLGNMSATEPLKVLSPEDQQELASR